MPLGIVYNPNIDPDMTIDQAVKEGYLTEAVVDNLCWALNGGDNLIKRLSKAMKKGEPVVKALRDLADEIERDYEFKKG